jgi:hypothetical protein
LVGVPVAGPVAEPHESKFVFGGATFGEFIC